MGAEGQDLGALTTGALLQRAVVIGADEHELGAASKSDDQAAELIKLICKYQRQQAEQEPEGEAAALGLDSEPPPAASLPQRVSRPASSGGAMQDIGECALITLVVVGFVLGVGATLGLIGCQFSALEGLCHTAMSEVLVGPLAVFASTDVVALAPDNFELQVRDSGKAAFVKFQSPW
jgi:hypothetical protein